MRPSLLVVLGILLLCLSTATAQSTQAPTVATTPFAIGETHTFQSTILSEERKLNVYLPASYHPDSAATYPVIYLLDGSRDEDFIHVAGLVQFLSFSWINIVPESIVVGIANVDRKRDFTSPSNNEKDNEFLPTNGGAGAFTRFLADEVQPLIKKTYNVSEERTLIGQSAGGLFATETLFIEPDLFDHYFIVSPSLWWNDESLLGADPVSLENVKSVHVAVGAEGDEMERVARELHVKLMARKPETMKLSFDYLPEKTHGDVLHAALLEGFERVFGKK
ncbi:MAG: alpha/beta hydrolase [Saprospiraceae bacterium]